SVVVARVCADGSAPAVTLPRQPVGDGDIHVDIVDLAAVRVAQTWTIPGVVPDSHTRTAELSARYMDGHIPAAVLTAGGGVEEPSRSFLLGPDGYTEISLPGYWTFA